MGKNVESAIKDICRSHGNDRSRLLDIVRAVQDRFGCVSSNAMDLIAGCVSAHRVEVEGVVSFYAFLSERSGGKVVIRLCNDVIDRMAGGDDVARAFSEELGIDFGRTTADGRIGLEYTPCIGMSDQAPAALVNDVVVTNLTPDSAREVVRSLKDHLDPKRLVGNFGDGNNAHELVRAMVNNNIRRTGSVILDDYQAGDALSNALGMTPAEVIREVKTARLRGRGGAGFPAGMKWEFARAADGKKRYVICNADEGEPGTFKDRVILTERADLLFEGMAIAGYAIGSDTGILYLRAEYAYLRPFLEHVLAQCRNKGFLGKDVCGKGDFDFDIRIQMGAGAYICGEETALISSCEGLRGEPRNRPPFPAQKGYLASPTVVNNVETLCCAARILDKGSGWFFKLGSGTSPGTKLLSVSGDCKKPGIYELPFGTKLSEILELADAEDAIAVQVGGPSGQMVCPQGYQRTINYEDLATGGSVMVFGPRRDPLKVAGRFMEFFVEESCGYCTPCRVGGFLLKQCLERILGGRGEPADLDYLQQLAETVKTASRCGLGQTSANPVLSTLQNFRSAYEARIKKDDQGFQRSFDIRSALSEAEAISGRGSVHFE